MPRTRRLIVPDTPLHLVQRGNNRGQVFFDPDDCRYYREIVFDASRRFDCAIHAYVLMSNHVHLLITPHDDSGPSRMMQTIGRRFVRTINARRRRTGTLWEGRYKSMAITDERYFLTCSRYIELNPVRAGIVERPQQYTWSSYRHNAQMRVDSLITEHPLYRRLGAHDADRRLAYRALFDTAVDPSIIDLIRYATKRCTDVEDNPAVSGRQSHTTRAPHGGDRKSVAFRSSKLRFQQL